MPTIRSIPIHVYYPVTDGEIVLRTDADWESDLLPLSIGDGSHFTFDIVSDKPFVYFKACLRQGSDHYWSVGENNLLIMDTIVEKTVHPHFFTPVHGSFSDLIELQSQHYDEKHKIRVFLPPGYAEKTLKRYPVLYMHDGNNLFLPEEASFGETWEVGEVLELMSSLRVTREVIVVGVWPVDRMAEYTNPGYDKYGKFLVEEVKPYIDNQYRTHPDRQSCAVMGSSLGGVVSFYLGWEYPDVYGMVACMSSTFGYQDDLRERVANEPKRDTRIYLDSGVPADNYEVTKDMYELLRKRGYRLGEDLLYFAFPQDVHNEKYWSMRSHLPYQYFFERE